MIMIMVADGKTLIQSGSLLDPNGRTAKTRVDLVVVVVGVVEIVTMAGTTWVHHRPGRTDPPPQGVDRAIATITATLLPVQGEEIATTRRHPNNPFESKEEEAIGERTTTAAAATAMAITTIIDKWTRRRTLARLT
jgi:hypothetical protein